MELIPSALPVLAAATVLAGGACLGATQSDDVDFERLFARSHRLGLVAEWLDISPTLAFWGTVATLTMAPVLLWQWYPVVGVVALVGLSLAFVFVERLLAPALATRTAARFEEQLPILADRLVSAVRGATPLLQALETVGPGLDPPLREAIVDLAAEATMGAGGLPEAVAAARDRHASRHFALILSVLSVFAERGGNLVAGAGIARCFTGPVSEVIAVTQRNRHQQGEAGERAVPPPVPPAPAQFMGAAIGGIGGKTIVQGGVRGRVSIDPTPQGLSRPGKAICGSMTRSGLRTGCQNRRIDQTGRYGLVAGFLVLGALCVPGGGIGKAGAHVGH